MSQKQITVFSKEEHNGKLVWVNIKGRKGLGEIFYDEDGSMYVFQNILKGLTPVNGISRAFWKFSYIYNKSEISVFELSKGAKEP